MAKAKRERKRERGKERGKEGKREARAHVCVCVCGCHLLCAQSNGGLTHHDGCCGSAFLSTPALANVWAAGLLTDLLHKQRKKERMSRRTSGNRHLSRGLPNKKKQSRGGASVPCVSSGHGGLT